MPAAVTPRTHVRDGLTLMCAGLAGWGIAPLAGAETLATPAAAAGALVGGGVMTVGARAARRDQLMARAAGTVSPLLAGGSVTAGRWTQGWPGAPRKIKVTYGTGRIKVAGEGPGGGVAIGDARWATEIVRTLGSVLEADYKVKTNQQQRGTMTLVRHVPLPEGQGAQAEGPEVNRAKRIVDELLGGTATFTSLETDEVGAVSRLKVSHGVGSKLVQPGYRARVERTLDGMLPGRWRALWDLEGDSVTFEVRPHLLDSVWIPPLKRPAGDPLQNYRSVQIPYGVDEDGEVLAWCPAINPQWLITGQTGSGKTSTGHGILAQITQFGWPAWVVDGKGTEFLGFQDWPNVQIVASRIEEQIAVIHRAWLVMEKRYELVVQGRARSKDFEPLVLFVDEFTDLRSNLIDWYAAVKVKGDPSKPRTFAELGSILRKGRTARVHMVLTMQRPDQADLTTIANDARENCGQRTSLGRLSPQGAIMMWNSHTTGVALPRGKTGRAIGVNKLGQPVEMQAYRVPDPGDVEPGTPEHDLIQALRPAETRHERYVIVPPEIDWAADDPVPLTYSDYVDADWVPASERPDLDPVMIRAATAAELGSEGTASSPMSLFTHTAVPKPRTSASLLEEPEPQLDEDDPQIPVGFAEDDLEGYTGLLTTAATDLQPGDLICVDPDVDAWAVVEDEPLEDFEDEDALVISWRDDQDESGQLILPRDALLQARRPLEEGA